MTTPTTPARRGPGRPADGGDRRTAIVAAARAEFAAKGYAAASIRGIAREAGVDPALVHHYFGTKEQVFVAAMELPFDPAERLPEVLAGDPARLGERLVRLFVSIWDEPDFRAPMLGLLRSAMTGDQGATMLREFVGGALLGRVAAAVGNVDPLRVQAAAAQMVGVVLLRHVVRLEPLASASQEDLVALVAPVVQRHLLG
ncbi:MAG TPA: TetR family transcriptional regulator [Actinomycetes bacterium]|nr:TetR family transcriptional regulator [Actinomycetes bacterium]